MKVNFPIFEAILFLPQSPWGQTRPYSDSWETMLWQPTGTFLLWEVLEVQVWLTNKQTLKLKWRKTVPFHNKSDNLEVALTVAFNMPSGTVLLFLCGISFISFKLFFFLHRHLNIVVYVFSVVSWKAKEDFSSTFPLVHVAHSHLFLCELFCGFLGHVYKPWPG